MNNLRAIAMEFGYTIYYPGAYCEKAVLVPTYTNGSSFEIDMKDRVKGMKEIEAKLNEITK